MKANKSRSKAKGKFESVEEGNVRVKIYTRTRRIGKARYKVFEVADYSKGSRHLRSFSDHLEAVKEAERIARLLASGDVEAAGLGAKERASYGRAIELIRDTGSPIELAASHYAEAFKILGSDRIVEAARFLAAHDPRRLTPKTVAEVVSELIANREARAKSKRYLQDLRSRLNRFADSFHVGIADVTTSDAQQWIDGLKVSAQTAKNFRTVLHLLFRFAEQRGYLPKGGNVIAHTERVEVRNGGAVEIYTPAELAKLLAAAPADFLPALALGAFAGLRSAEIERLEWPDVDLASGHITVAAEKAKTASRRIVPISPALAAWLTPHAKRAGLVWRGTHEEFYDAQKATAESAGIAWKTNGLRHSFISYRLASVQSAAQVALEAGNSSAVVFKHYRELVRPADALAWFAVAPETPANVTPLRHETATA